MIAYALRIENLRTWLAAAPTPILADVVSALRDELAGRLAFDASNYLTRAVAALDAERFAASAPPATTEP